MAIKQLTVFVENRKGTMASVTDTLSKNNVNISPFCHCIYN